MLSYQKLDKALLKKIDREKSFSKNFIDFVIERNNDCHLYDSFLSSNPVVDTSTPKIQLFNTTMVGILVLLGIMLCEGFYFNNFFATLILGIFVFICIVLYCIRLLIQIMPFVCYKYIQKGCKCAILEGIEKGMTYKNYLEMIK